MYPYQHLILGILFSLILFVIFPEIGLIGVLLIIFSTVLIDIDHYFYTSFRKKNFNFFKIYKWHIKADEKFRKLKRSERNKTFVAWCFLHGLEILLILALATFFISHYFIFVLTGFTFHLFLDIVYEKFFIFDDPRKLSIIYSFIRKKKLKHLRF